jgi:membrane associated rhomboid family serine protease
VQGDGDAEKLPVWARVDAFPSGSDGWGWVNRKGVRQGCSSLEELEGVLRADDKGLVMLVWTPESGRCVVPEEVEGLTRAIVEVRRRWVVEDMADGVHRVKMLGGGLTILFAYLFYGGWRNLEALERANGLSFGIWDKSKWILKEMSQSTTVGLALLIFLVFAFIPWYQAFKKSRELMRGGVDTKGMISTLRFETWLEMQRAPLTWVILGLVGVVFLVQVVVDRNLFGIGGSLQRAGLIKSSYWGGEYWRILTAPMLHGGVVHFVMNALGLLYLGKRMEVFARWPHLPAVFIFSAMVGGEATARFLDVASVGASGGLMGWLGFLLVFETLHSRLVPRSARRRLLGGLVVTVMIGLVGYRFIDNAAHLGGLVAGMVYAGIVFPKSASVERPKMNMTDRLLGVGAMILVIGSVGLTIYKVCE